MSTLTSYATPTVRIPRQPATPVLDATRLWAGGLASAVVAALVGLVGTLVVRVLAANVPDAPHAAAFGTQPTVMLCLVAAGAALAATGLAHVLMVSTPRPFAYLGWIVGLATAAATVLPLAGGAPLAVAAASGAINLVIGLAIGSLVAGAAAGATRIR
jgi:small-conductance mechanosensitive channel